MPCLRSATLGLGRYLTSQLHTSFAASVHLGPRTYGERVESEARWAYDEWLSLARRRYDGGDAALYSPGTGRAAVLAQRDDQTLEVLAALGMRWKPGRTVSRRSLRGLKTLKGGASWS